MSIPVGEPQEKKESHASDKSDGETQLVAELRVPSKKHAPKNQSS